MATPQRLVLLGHPIGHSLSPLLQNAALRAAGIDITYVPLDIPRSALDDTIDDLRRTRSAGNVTIPYKEDVFAACDRCTESARAVGAINTFWIAIDGALVGDNTDVAGFNAAIRRLIGAPREGERLALIGAGGGAAAVLRAVEGWPNPRVRVYSRTRDRAAKLVQRLALDAEVVASPEAAIENATLVVNATPVGLHDQSMPVPVELLPKECAVLDLAYRTDETPLVRAARARGHRAADGLTMLVEQGALAFERWFGRAPDREAMWGAVSSSR